MGETELPAQRLEPNRNHLQAVAYRMLGSHNEPEGRDAPEPA
jgi:hypothetical protein